MGLMYIQYFWLIIFGFILYVVIINPNVLTAVGYVSKIFEVKYKRFKWWLVNNPSNPIVKYFIWRRSMKMAERIKKSLESRTK